MAARPRERFVGRHERSGEGLRTGDISRVVGGEVVTQMPDASEESHGGIARQIQVLDAKEGTASLID